MNEGDLIKIPLPQADGLIKSRPALVLRKVPPFNDLLICGNSSKIHNYVEGLDVIISSSHKDFKKSGLKTSSVIRSAYLMLLAEKDTPGSIGSISTEKHQQVLKNLSDFLKN